MNPSLSNIFFNKNKGKVLETILDNFPTILIILSALFAFFLVILKFVFHFKFLWALLISLVIVGLMFLYLFLKVNEIAGKAGYLEKWNDLYGKRIYNIPYFKDDKIINTYKKGGENFIEEIGEINKGNDYKKNERNYYDIYIPYTSLKKKDKYNGIILFIHGGAWVIGDKEDVEFLCIRFSKLGYITAQMNYTLLIKKYKENNIFRIMDEVTACIKSIKNELKNEGFDENKLELAIGGASAGGHISLLYAYSIKNSPIRIKFVIDLVGPISLEPKFLYKIKDNEKSLETIEFNDIKNALKENKLEFTIKDETYLVELLNSFIENRFSKEELKEMIENKKIKNDNEKYKQLLKLVQYSFPIKYINKETIPTFCVYGGRDSEIGIANYGYLKKLSEKYGNKVECVYMKNAEHMLVDYDTKEGIYAMREMNYQVLNFCQTYFTRNK